MSSTDAASPLRQKSIDNGSRSNFPVVLSLSVGSDPTLYQEDSTPNPYDDEILSGWGSRDVTSGVHPLGVIGVKGSASWDVTVETSFLDISVTSGSLVRSVHWQGGANPSKTVNVNVVIISGGNRHGIEDVDIIRLNTPGRGAASPLRKFFVQSPRYVVIPPLVVGKTSPASFPSSSVDVGWKSSSSRCSTRLSSVVLYATPHSHLLHDVGWSALLVGRENDSRWNGRVAAMNSSVPRATT